MQAIHELMEEHRVIERVLDALDAAAGRLQRGEPVRPGFFVDVADFATRFADGCHHRKEEGVLFPTMAQHGLPVHEGPLAAMLHEHDAGRSYVRRLRDAAQDLGAGHATAVPQVITAARGYVALLREHILKEDSVLFPMAEHLIPVAEQDRVAADFARVEHDDTGHLEHARLLELARALEREGRMA